MSWKTVAGSVAPGRLQFSGWKEKNKETKADFDMMNSIKLIKIQVDKDLRSCTAEIRLTSWNFQWGFMADELKIVGMMKVCEVGLWQLRAVEWALEEIYSEGETATKSCQKETKPPKNTLHAANLHAHGWQGEWKVFWGKGAILFHTVSRWIPTCQKEIEEYTIIYTRAACDWQLR